MLVVVVVAPGVSQVPSPLKNVVEFAVPVPKPAGVITSGVGVVISK
jgi:hypothetical protein